VNQFDYPLILHAVGDPCQQSLMMDSVKKFGQIQINRRLITSFQVPSRAGLFNALY
jgi:hypothetical protein